MKNHKVSLTGIHLDLTQALKDIVNQKLEKLFRHTEGIMSAKVELECSSHKNNPTEFIAKGILSLRGPNIVIETSTDNLYKSIDQMVDKLDRKIRRRARLFKAKRKDCHEIEIPAALPKVMVG